MKMTDLIELSWPQSPDTASILDCAPQHQKVVTDFIIKHRDANEISLAVLIDFADRDDTPSVKLKSAAVAGLVGTLGYGCGSTTKELLRRRLSLGLSLVPRYHWAERLEFVGGPLTVQYTGGQSCTDEIRKVRKDILK